MLDIGCEKQAPNIEHQKLVVQNINQSVGAA